MTETSRTGVMTIAWIWVGASFAYGVYALINRAIPLFTGG